MANASQLAKLYFLKQPDMPFDLKEKFIEAGIAACGSETESKKVIEEYRMM